MLRRLDREVVGNSRRRIGPEIGRDLLGRAQAHIDVGGDVVRFQAELGRPRTIDVGEERRSIDLLLEMRIGDSRNCRDPSPELLRHPQVRRPVVADGPHIDLCRKAEIEDLRHDVGRLEIEGHLRERGRQDLAQLSHVVGGRGVTLLERHQDHAVVDADGRAVGKGEVIGARRQPDIVHDQLALALGNDLANLVLDRLEDAFGRLDPGGRRRPDVELDLTAVDGWKEVAPDEGSASRPRAPARGRR